MASGATLTTLANTLKTRYADQSFVERLTFKDRPLLAMLPKWTEFTGDGFTYPTIYEDPQSISASFSTAQAAAASNYTRAAKFTATRVNLYGVVTISGEASDAADGNAGSYIKATQEQTDGVMRAQSTRLASALYRKGWGAIGQCATSGAASATMDLVNPRDGVNFAVGQAIQFSSAETGATLRDSAKSLTIVGISRGSSTTTLTFSANTNTVSSLTANDYMFTAGDRHDSASTVRLMPAGLEDWIPFTAPTSAAFFGVDRTADIVRLAGFRYDGSAQSVEDALIDGVGEGHNNSGGEYDAIFTNPAQVKNLIKAMGSKVIYSDVSVGKLSFRGVVLQTEFGDIKVYGDRFCPSDRAYALTLSTWKLGSIGPVPKILDRDGHIFFRSYNDDADEVRIGMRGNLFCKGPGLNCVMKLATP